MDILYVSQYFPPEMGAPAARASELSYHWVSAGHQVTVLTGFPNHPTGTIPENYRAPFRRLVFHETVRGVSVVRSWLLPFPNRKSWERMLNYSSFCLSSALTGLQIPRPDLVIGSSPQLLVALSAYWIARLKRVPFIFEVRDLWPESLSAVGVGGENSLLHRLLRGIASYLYSQADQVVVVTPAFKQFLAEKYQVPIDKISIIPNGVETAHFSPEMKDEFLHRRLGIKSEFTVCYIGTLGMAHGLETLIEAARRLQATHPQITFLIVGEGSEKQHLMNLANALRLKNVRFVDPQPRELVPQFANASDAAAVLLKKSEVFKTVIPSKMLEFMSCARPVIAGVEGQAQELLQDAHAGICFEPGNVLALVDAILTLFSQPSLRESCGRNGRRYIIQNLSRKQTAFDYVNVLQNVLFPVSAKSRAA